MYIAWLGEEASEEFSDLSKINNRLAELQPEKNRLDAEFTELLRQKEKAIRDKVGRVTKVIPLNNNGVIPR